MTLATTSNTTVAQGNGLTTSFDFPFPVPNASELFVYLTNAGSSPVLLSNSQYSTTGIGTGNGGSVTYPLAGSPIPTGSSLTIQREVTYQQLTSLVDQSGYYPNVVENALDYLTMQTQQLAQAELLTITVPLESTIADLVLPTAAGRADALVGFDASGNVITYPVSASVGAGNLTLEGPFLNGTGFTPGVTTTLTLSKAYGSAANVSVHFDTEYQDPTQYTLSGNQIIFSSPIPNVQAVTAVGGTTLSVGVPSNGSVGTAQLSPIIAKQLASYVNVLAFGADPTGATDSTAALTAAIASCQASAVKVYFPAGTYYFASAPVISMTSSQTNPAGLSVLGDGSGVTRFKFAGSGFTVNYGSAYSSVHFEGISFLSPSAGGNAGLTLIQNAMFATGFGQYGVSTLRDLEFRGDDGFNEAHWWGVGVDTLGASNVNWYDCTFYGPTGTPSGAGISLGYAQNDPTIIPIVYNVMGCSFTHLQSGLIYGGNCQGLTVLYSNFTANFVGIIVPSGSSAVDQLLINASQFNNINDSILFQNWCQAVSIANCFFLVSNNSVAINFALMANMSVVGNIFSTANGSPVNQQGIQVSTYSQGAGVITGNQFNGISVAVALLAGSKNVNVQSNCYIGNGANVNNAGTGNTIGGGSI